MAEVEMTQEEIAANALSEAQNAVDMFHAQVKLDPAAQEAFKTLVTTHAMFNGHRSESAEMRDYAMYFNSAFMAADLISISGDTLKTCYSQPMPTREEVDKIEACLTKRNLVSVYLDEYTTPNGSKLPAFFATVNKGDLVGEYDFCLIPDLPETPTVVFRMKVSVVTVTGIQVQVVDGHLQMTEMRPAPSGIVALTRGAMVAVSLIEEALAS